MKKKSQSRAVHLVGSIPLSSTEAVFDLVGSHLGTLCTRVPDGETGVRRNWIGWQFDCFSRQTALQQAQERERDYQLHPPFVFKPGKCASDLEFGDLGFARAALRSYDAFAAKQSAAILPESARFLVALPTPFAPVYSFTSYAIQEQVYPIYEHAILVELEQICSAIPHNKLAVQWDVATEMSIFEKVYEVPFESAWDVLLGRLAVLAAHVPPKAELGYHLCYGSMNNRHWKEPGDLGLCVAVSNAVARQVSRPIQFLHMPVPIDRTDDGYFAPLKDLQVRQDTELFLGLVHDADGSTGNRARIAAAARVCPQFGISTECGLGRRNPEDLPHLLALHVELANQA